MLKLGTGVCFALFALQVACGSSEQKPAEYPPPPAPSAEEAADPSWDTGERPADPEPEPTAPAAAAADQPLKEPEFKPGMSVNEAIAAVPSHYEYVGIEPEVLAKPLTNMDTYKECKVGQNDHFSVRVAVWEGRVVGADVTAATPSKKECIDRVVRAVEYKEQVKSINTVEFAF